MWNRNAVLLAAFVLLAARAHAGLSKKVAEDYGPVFYKFAYGVNDPHTGDKKDHYEIRDGDNVKGAYTMQEADGTIRVVEYTAGPHKGFNAVVKRIGHAVHPQVYKTYGGYGKSGGGGGGGGDYDGGKSRVGGGGGYETKEVVSEGGEAPEAGHGVARSYVDVVHYGYNKH